METASQHIMNTAKAYKFNDFPVITDSDLVTVERNGHTAYTYTYNPFGTEYVFIATNYFAGRIFRGEFFGTYEVND